MCRNSINVCFQFYPDCNSDKKGLEKGLEIHQKFHSCFRSKLFLNGIIADRRERRETAQCLLKWSMEHALILTEILKLAAHVARLNRSPHKLH